MKNIILISYDFPPLSGPRSLRWLQFVKYLSKDYLIDVLTIQPEKGYGNYDRSLIYQIPKNVRIYRTYPGFIHRFSYRYLPLEKIKKVRKKSFKIILRKGIKNIYKNILSPFLIPDKMVEWLPWGLKKAKNLVRKKKYDLIISSAVPFIDHLIGYFIKKKTGISWIADYGDPWAFNPFFPFPWRRHFIDCHLEAKLIKNMDNIIVTTKETADGFVKHYPFLDCQKITIIPCGYDYKDFQQVKPDKGKKFRIVYTGIFYKDRSPDIFLKSIKELNFDFELVIAGDISPEYIKIIEDLGIEEKVKLLGHQSHQQAIALQKGADVLLLLGWLKGYQIPAKIFEYFGACCPILSIKFDEKDIAARLIQKYNRGFIIYNNTKEIISAIKKMYNLWQKGKFESCFDLGELKEYSWDILAENLKKLIEKVTFNS